MAAFNNSKSDGPIAAINIIPFVDIVLVLLIIFMVTSTAIVKAAIKVDLPTAASAGQSVSATVNLVLTREKELIYDGEVVSDSDLAAKLQAAVRENKELQAVISADKRLPYGDVVSLIDLIKQNGVATFALNIEREIPGVDKRAPGDGVQ